MFWRVAVGQAMAPDHTLGRLFSPMVEFLAVRDFKPGASTNWDVLPEMQITVKATTCPDSLWRKGAAHEYTGANSSRTSVGAPA
jgi:hypothetical protein